MYETQGYRSQQPSGYGNSRRDEEDILSAAEKFVNDQCQEIDRALNNRMGEEIFRLVTNGFNRYIGDVVNNLRYFEDAARRNRDNPLVMAGCGLGGWLMYSVIQTSDRRIADDIRRYAGQTFDMIAGVSGDYASVMGLDRRRESPGYGNSDYGREAPASTGAGAYGSRGQKNDLFVSHSEPTASRRSGSTLSNVAGGNMASLFMEAEADTQPGGTTHRPESSHVEPTEREYQRAEESRPDPLRAKTGSMMDWMSDGANFTPVEPVVKPSEPAFEYGTDPHFNNMFDAMQHSAQDRDIRHHNESSAPMRGVDIVDESELQVIDGGEVHFQPNFDDLSRETDESGVMEDLDDVAFNPADEQHDALALLNFAARTLNNSTACGGWKFYENDVDGDVAYDRRVTPWPMAYDAIHYVKFRFINPEGLLVEFIKPKYPEDTDVEMQDHIAELLIVQSKGSSVNVLELLQKTEQRIDVSDNRREVAADEATGIEAVVATADRKAFDTSIRNTTSDVIAKAIKDKLSKDREVTIEGFNERRLVPVYMGADGFKEMDKFRHIVAGMATFDKMASKLPDALSKMPEGFRTVYLERLTARFNDYLRNRMAMSFHVQNFTDDFADAKALLIEELGETTATEKLNAEFKQFSRFAKILPREATRYTDILGSALATEDYAVFVTTIATVTLPFSTVDGMGVVPDKEERFVGVAESQSPHLHKLLSTVRKSAQEVFNNPADIVRVITTDNAVFYVDTGAFAVDGDCYIVSHRSRVADLLS